MAKKKRRLIFTAYFDPPNHSHFQFIENYIKEHNINTEDIKIYLYIKRFSYSKESLLKLYLYDLKDDRFVISRFLHKTDFMVHINEACDKKSIGLRRYYHFDTEFNVFYYMIINKMYKYELFERVYERERFLHALEVAKLCYNMALSNKLEHPDRYFQAGLLHDCGKFLDAPNHIKKRLNMMERYYTEYFNENCPDFAHHQFLGVYYANTVFQVEDEEILEAIKWHCTGQENMGKMAKILYVCDKIEPNRKYFSEFFIKECYENIEEGFPKIFNENLEFLSKHNSPESIKNKYTLNCINYYLKGDIKKKWVED